MTEGLGPDITAMLTFPLSFSVPSHILVLAFALMVVCWGIFASIFIYHWRKFPYDKPLLRAGERLFLAVSFVLIIAALSGIIVA